VIGREFKLLFKSTSGNLLIVDLYMDLVCKCQGGRLTEVMNAYYFEGAIVYLPEMMPTDNMYCIVLYLYIYIALAGQRDHDGQVSVADEERWQRKVKLNRRGS